MYCSNCKKELKNKIKEKLIKLDIKGTSITFLGKVAYCPVCKDEFYTDEIIDYNIHQAQEAYRLKKNIITQDQIEALLKKYNIGKRNLSKILGWGEVTITRFCNGQIPSKHYSNLLMELVNNAEKYREILIKNKSKISSKAYNKSFNAVKESIKNINESLEFGSYIALSDIEIDQKISYTPSDIEIDQQMIYTTKNEVKKIVIKENYNDNGKEAA